MGAGAPGRTGAGGVRGDRRRKGGKRDLYEGEIQKGKRLLLLTGYNRVKNTNPVTFFDFNLISSEALNNFYMRGNVHSHSA